MSKTVIFKVYGYLSNNKFFISDTICHYRTKNQILRSISSAKKKSFRNYLRYMLIDVL